MPESIPSPEEVYLEGLREQAPPPPPEMGTKPISKRSFLAHHDAHPFALDVMMLKAFGPTCYARDASTVWSELSRLYSTTISELNKNKIEAVRTLHLADTPWRRWEVFEKVIQTLNNNIPRFDTMQKCSIPQLCNGVKIMNMIRRERFRGDVPEYVAAVFMDDGVSFCPSPLDFARTLVYQRKDVREAFLSYTEDDRLAENAKDVQVARLVAAKKYVDMRDSQLKQQLELMQESPAL